jgi:hypothetical protein
MTQAGKSLAHSHHMNTACPPKKYIRFRKIKYSHNQLLDQLDQPDHTIMSNNLSSTIDGPKNDQKKPTTWLSDNF